MGVLAATMEATVTIVVAVVTRVRRSMIALIDCLAWNILGAVGSDGK